MLRTVPPPPLNRIHVTEEGRCEVVMVVRVDGGYMPVELIVEERSAVWVLGWCRWPAKMGRA